VLDKDVLCEVSWLGPDLDVYLLPLIADYLAENDATTRKVNHPSGKLFYREHFYGMFNEHLYVVSNFDSPLLDSWVLLTKDFFKPRFM